MATLTCNYYKLSALQISASHNFEEISPPGVFLVGLYNLNNNYRCRYWTSFIGPIDHPDYTPDLIYPVHFPAKLGGIYQIVTDGYCG